MRLRLIFGIELTLLFLWMIVENIYTSDLFVCLFAIVGLIFFVISVEAQYKNINYKLKVIIVMINVLILSFYLMEIGSEVFEHDLETKLPFSYTKLQSVGYSLMYLSIVCLFIILHNVLVR